jgi:uncharacterized protein YjbI with pentapeptide repeats
MMKTAVVVLLVLGLVTRASSLATPYQRGSQMSINRRLRVTNRNLEVAKAPVSSQLASIELTRSSLYKISAMIAAVTFSALLSFSVPPAQAADLGGNDTSNTKIKRGGASTLQQGITKTITRGVNLDGSDFGGQNMKGVAFQQSIVRDANFKDCNLYSASFFDATCDGSNFENADLTLANLELAQFKRANFKNAVLRQMYVVGGTNFEGIATIENSDWSETELRKDQRKYLCEHPTAKGTNSQTGENTRDSLLCPE